MDSATAATNTSSITYHQRLRAVFLSSTEMDAGDDGWTPQEVADHFHEVLGQHLQPVGMGEHPLLGKKD